MTIAEDRLNGRRLTSAEVKGGTGFDVQWGALFVHPIRAAVISPNVCRRFPGSIRQAIEGRYNGPPFPRVIFRVSHLDMSMVRDKTLTQENEYENTR